MLLPNTEAIHADAGAGFGPATLDRLTLALKSASTERLKASFVKQAAQLNTPGALRVSAELTARGIAPCFRGLPTTREWWTDAIEAKLILLISDLQWIVANYPKHQTHWERAQHVHDPAKLEKTAAYLLWDGKRAPGQVAKALGLTDQQQRECAWVQCLHMERWRLRLSKRLPVAETMIMTAVRSNDKRDKTEQDATIKRRVNLWHCAELANWKPQRTADLFLMLTGESLPRNVVANQLAKLPKVRRTDLVYSLEGPAVG